MSFILFIMRHAKSDWSTSNQSDFDRPINKRGRKSAKRIGQWMRDNDVVPQLLVSSTALRARETTELVVAELGQKKPEQILYEDGLYLADVDKLIESIQIYKTGLNSLMLVAHNPGLEQLVSHLSDQASRETINSKALTTANLVIFKYPDVSFNPDTDKGQLIYYIKPKELD